MSFPEAVKQVLFGGVVDLARAPLPSHRRVLPNGSVSFLTLIFFCFFRLLLLGSFLRCGARFRCPHSAP